jgi:hypothetical protein
MTGYVIGLSSPVRRWRGEAPQSVSRTRRHPGWNKPEGVVGGLNPEGYIPIVLLREFPGSSKSERTMDLTIQQWPYGQKKFGQEPSCQEVYT